MFPFCGTSSEDYDMLVEYPLKLDNSMVVGLQSLTLAIARLMLRCSRLPPRARPTSAPRPLPSFARVRAFSSKTSDEEPIAKLRTAAAAIAPLRSLPTFSHLRWNLNTARFDGLANKVGQIISLPNLGVLPKELDLPSLSNYLLTEQRFVHNSLFGLTHVRLALATEVMKGLQLERGRLNNGIVLSGPHGVGKSHVSYLLAATAFVNQNIVGYWVLCSFSFCC